MITVMTTEQMRQYLADGGTDMQHLMEWVAEHSTDPTARQLTDMLFANINQAEPDDEDECAEQVHNTSLLHADRGRSHRAEPAPADALTNSSTEVAVSKEPDVKVHHTAGCELCGNTDEHTHTQDEWRALIDSKGNQAWGETDGDR